MADTTTLFSGYTVLCANSDGSMPGPRHGLLHADTRVLSRHRLTLGGEVPSLVAQTQPESDRWEAILRVPRPGAHAEGPGLPQDAFEIRVTRRVGPGLEERIQVVNHSAEKASTELTVELDADFADVAELGRERQQQGRITRRRAATSLQFRYRADNDGRRFEHSLKVGVDNPSSDAEVRVTGFRFAIELVAGGSWQTTLRYSVLEGRSWRTPEAGEPGRRARQRAVWRTRRPVIECADALQTPFERAADDLFDLRNWELEQRLLGGVDGSRWLLNAGVPTFTGLFGRDTITSGWQSALLGQRAALGALEAVAGLQATTDDPWRDAEPGKLIHELRSGPLSGLGLTPRDAYYGTQTTVAMFVLALSEVWHWTGDVSVLRRHRDVAVKAIEWAETYGDRDDDGFLEYERRSPKGLRNQGWKDSDEAIRDVAGRLVDGPIATVEEQAFYYLALQRFAEILMVLEEDDRADLMLARAAALAARWHETYWMPEEGFYAMALDGQKRQVRSIASNPGHALGTGIVPRSVAERVADRLLAPDLFSGWGVRSLSDRHPSYNPFAYHLGAVWPVEQATFVLGFKRYGLDRHLDRLVEGVFAAANLATDGRLREALSGHARDTVPAPIPYPEANSPQAWSASALVQLVQITLGIYPFAPLGVLAIVRPRLPEAVPHLVLRRLPIGRATVDLEFGRRDDGSASWRVVHQRGRIVVIGVDPPQDVAEGNVLRAIERAVLAHAPGRYVKAARIAVGLTGSSDSTNL